MLLSHVRYYSRGSGTLKGNHVQSELGVTVSLQLAFGVVRGLERSEIPLHLGLKLTVSSSFALGHQRQTSRFVKGNSRHWTENLLSPVH
jgi:hypothetical protein